MAESHITTNSQKVFSEIIHSTLPNPPRGRFFITTFLVNGIYIASFVAVLPFLSSQAPEFVKETFLNKAWDVIRLLVIGIAVSYGVFSRWNSDGESENHEETYSNQAHVSNFLQVPPVFVNVEESLYASESKTQIWNFQYTQEEPLFSSTQRNQDLDIQINGTFDGINKPIFLPVRSLTTHVRDENSVESVNEFNRFSLFTNDFGSSARDSLNVASEVINAVSGSEISDSAQLETRLIDSELLVEKSRRNGVLHTRSMSQSQMNKINTNLNLNTESKLGPPSLANPEKSPRSFSPKLQNRIGEGQDVKKNAHTFHSPRTSSPYGGYEHSRDVMDSSIKRDGFSYENLNPRILKEYSIDVKRNNGECFPHEKESKNPKDHMNYGEQMYYSFLKPPDSRRSFEKGKSVRTVRTSSISDVQSIEKVGDGRENKSMKKSQDFKVDNIVKRDDLMIFNPESEKSNHDSRLGSPAQKITVFSKSNLDRRNRKKDLATKVIPESEDLDRNFVSRQSHEEISNSANEVDKKADEFIAKFREQIRQQREESNKRSSEWRGNRNSRY